MAKHAVSEDDILAAIDQCFLHGSVNVMRDHERQFGFTPIAPGEATWLPSSDWADDIVVALDGVRVRIVAIYARSCGNGAFSRLVTNIIRAGLLPVVVAPMGRMTDILTAWGWHHRMVGKSFDERRDEWFPTRKWREQRLQCNRPGGE